MTCRFFPETTPLVHREATRTDHLGFDKTSGVPKSRCDVGLASRDPRTFRSAALLKSVSKINSTGNEYSRKTYNHPVINGPNHRLTGSFLCSLMNTTG